jgi:hypothetical protein
VVVVVTAFFHFRSRADNPVAAEFFLAGGAAAVAFSAVAVIALFKFIDLDNPIRTVRRFNKQAIRPASRAGVAFFADVSRGHTITAEFCVALRRAAVIIVIVAVIAHFTKRRLNTCVTALLDLTRGRAAISGIGIAVIAHLIFLSLNSAISAIGRLFKAAGRVAAVTVRIIAVIALLGKTGIALGFS